MCSSPSPQVGWSGGPVHPRRALGALQLASPFSANSRFAPGPKQTGPERKFNLQVRPRPNFRFRSRSCRTQVNLRVWGQLGLYRNTLVTECGFGSQLPVGGGRGERRKTIQVGPVGSGTPSARRPAPARYRSLPWIRKRNFGSSSAGAPPGAGAEGGSSSTPCSRGSRRACPPPPWLRDSPGAPGLPGGPVVHGRDQALSDLSRRADARGRPGAAGRDAGDAGHAPLQRTRGLWRGLVPREDRGRHQERRHLPRGEEVRLPQRPRHPGGGVGQAQTVQRPGGPRVSEQRMLPSSFPAALGSATRRGSSSASPAPGGRWRTAWSCRSTPTPPWSPRSRRS